MLKTGAPIGTVSRSVSTTSWKVTSTAASVGPYRLCSRGAGQLAQTVRGLAAATPHRRRTPSAATRSAATSASATNTASIDGTKCVDGDALDANDLREVRRIAMAVGLRDHQLRTDLQGPEELPHRHVEGRRGLLQDDVGLGQAVRGLHPHQTVDDRAMADRHTLRTTGRTRREDHIRRVLRTQRHDPLGLGDAGVGVAVQIEQVDPDLRGVDLRSVPEVSTQTGSAVARMYSVRSAG